MPPRLSKWSLPASLVLPRLSKWSCPASLAASKWCLFPASLVPPWCLPGCPISPFLLPWCLAGCPIGLFLPPWFWTGAGFCPNLSTTFNGQRPGSLQILGWASRQAVRSIRLAFKRPASLVGPTSRVPFLVPPWLSKWSFPASLVSPWCLAGRSCLVPSADPWTGARILFTF